MQAITAQTSWLDLWKNHWSYRHWLICSGITSLLSMEFYNLFLSIYPDAFMNLYLSWGIQSMFLSTIISYAGILALGLLSGWILYSAHLAYLAIKTNINTIQPIIALWQSSTNDNQLFFQQLFQDENFIKLSKFLNQVSIPLGFKEFIKKGEHTKELQSIITLLCRLWSIQKPSEKIQLLTLKILEDLNFQHDFKPQMEKISSLIAVLTQAGGVNEELFNKAIELQEDLHLEHPLFSKVCNNQDLLVKMIEHPEIAECVLDYEEHIDTASGVGIGHINQFCDSLIHPQSKLEHWLITHFAHSRAEYIQLWERYYRQPCQTKLEKLIIFMDAQPECENIFRDASCCLQLFNIFNRADFISSEDFPRICANLEFLVNEQALQFSQALMILHHRQLFTTTIIERIIAFKNIDEIMEIINQPAKLSTEDLLQRIDQAEKIAPGPKMPSKTNLLEMVPAPPVVRAPGFWARFFAGFDCRNNSATMTSPRPGGY